MAAIIHRIFDLGWSYIFDLRAILLPVLFAVAMAIPSSTPAFTIAVAWAAALVAASPLSLWLCRFAKLFAFQGTRHLDHGFVGADLAIDHVRRILLESPNIGAGVRFAFDWAIAAFSHF